MSFHIFIYLLLPISSECPLHYIYVSIFGIRLTLLSLNLSPTVSILYILYLNATPPRGPLLLITGPHHPHHVDSLMSSWSYDLGSCTVGRYVGYLCSEVAAHLNIEGREAGSLAHNAQVTNTGGFRWSCSSLNIMTFCNIGLFKLTEKKLRSDQSPEEIREYHRFASFDHKSSLTRSRNIMEHLGEDFLIMLSGLYSLTQPTHTCTEVAF